MKKYYTVPLPNPNPALAVRFCFYTSTFSVVSASVKAKLRRRVLSPRMAGVFELMSTQENATNWDAEAGVTWDADVANLQVEC